jgi:hypothetical protein
MYTGLQFQTYCVYFVNYVYELGVTFCTENTYQRSYMDERKKYFRVQYYV